MNVLVIDSHPVYREGLVVMLNQCFPQWQIITESSAYNGINILKNSKVSMDLLLVSINTQNEENFYQLEEILKYATDVVSIALSSGVDTLYLKKVLETGVRGIIPKVYPIKEMTGAIRECWQGGVHIPVEVRKTIYQCRQQTEAANLLRLTQRQLQVLELIGKRMTNREIAEILFVSLATIKTHINRIYNALEVKCRKECIQRSYDLGVLSPPQSTSA